MISLTPSCSILDKKDLSSAHPLLSALLRPSFGVKKVKMYTHVLVMRHREGMRFLKLRFWSNLTTRLE